MGNAVKYSATSLTGTIKKGNVLLGTDTIAYGSTATTDYWSGVDPSLVY